IIMKHLLNIVSALSGDRIDSVSSNALAQLSQEVTFSLYANKGTNEWKWLAAGAINDDGNWEDDGQPDWTNGLHDTYTLTSKNRTLTCHFDGQIIPTSNPDIIRIEGSWYIITGTGLYANLQGQGKGSTLMNQQKLIALVWLDGKVKYTIAKLSNLEDSTFKP